MDKLGDNNCNLRCPSDFLKGKRYTNLMKLYCYGYNSLWKYTFQCYERKLINEAIRRKWKRYMKPIPQHFTCARVFSPYQLLTGPKRLSFILQRDQPLTRAYYQPRCGTAAVHMRRVWYGQLSNRSHLRSRGANWNCFSPDLALSQVQKLGN